MQALQELGGEASNDEIDKAVIDILKLPKEMLDLQYEESEDWIVKNRINFARSYAKKVSLLKNPRRSFWSLTELAEDLLNLKKSIIKKRTNPIIHNTRIGGVAYNIAELISIFDKIQFYSLSINKELQSKISKNISIKKISNKKSERYYVALSDKNNKFILGLANTDVYENTKFYKIPNIINKYIIFDLNFSKDFIEKAINKLSTRNKIVVCATSVHKIIKIKKIINQIDIIFLNKAELIKLTNIDSIEQGVKKILKINNKIKIVATNSKNNVFYADNKSIIKLKPPKIEVKNLYFNYEIRTYLQKFYSLNNSPQLIIDKSHLNRIIIGSATTTSCNPTKLFSQQGHGIPQTGNAVCWLKFGAICIPQHGYKMRMKVVASNGYGSNTTDTTQETTLLFQTANTGEASSGSSVCACVHSFIEGSTKRESDAPYCFIVHQVNSSFYEFFGNLPA